MKPRYTYLITALATPFLSLGILDLVEKLLLNHSFTYISDNLSMKIFIASTFVLNFLIVFFTQPKLSAKEFTKKYLLSLVFTTLSTFTFFGIVLIYFITSGDFVGC